MGPHLEKKEYSKCQTVIYICEIASYVFKASRFSIFWQKYSESTSSFLLSVHLGVSSLFEVTEFYISSQCKGHNVLILSDVNTDQVMYVTCFIRMFVDSFSKNGDSVQSHSTLPFSKEKFKCIPI